MESAPPQLAYGLIRRHFSALRGLVVCTIAVVAVPLFVLAVPQSPFCVGITSQFFSFMLDLLGVAHLTLGKTIRFLGGEIVL